MASSESPRIFPRQAPSPIEYEQSIYAKGLSYERPQISLKATEWEPQAEARLSAESKGYLVGNAGTGETTDKIKRAFRQWSIVPQRMIKVDGMPDLSTKVLGRQLQYPVALAPAGVQRE
jgi:lactate 2-monooxygenase